MHFQSVMHTRVPASALVFLRDFRFSVCDRDGPIGAPKRTLTMFKASEAVSRQLIGRLFVPPQDEGAQVGIELSPNAWLPSKLFLDRLPLPILQHHKATSPA